MARYAEAPVDAPLPAEWTIAAEPCSCGETAPRYHVTTKTFFRVPCEGAVGGAHLSWPCKNGHWQNEFAAGRDPIGRGGRRLVKANEGGYTQRELLAENIEGWRAQGNKDVQRTSRT